jgi:hypothetical protein
MARLVVVCQRGPLNKAVTHTLPFPGNDAKSIGIFATRDTVLVWKRGGSLSDALILGWNPLGSPKHPCSTDFTPLLPETTTANEEFNVLEMVCSTRTLIVATTDGRVMQQWAAGRQWICVPFPSSIVSLAYNGDASLAFALSGTYYATD